MTNLTTAPKWFTISAIVALLWNLMGVGAYVSQTMMTPDMLALLPEAERNMYENFPLWANIAFFIAVVGGTLGCIGLLMKKKWALQIFILSLVGVIVHMIYNVFISGAMEIYGPASFIMPIMILVIAITLIWLSRKAIGNSWIV